MASLSANASLDEIEEELEFQDVLISSLDGGADDYAERLAEIEATKSELERRLEAVRGSAPSQSSQAAHDTSNMDASDVLSHGGWQQTYNNVAALSGFHNISLFGDPYPRTNVMKRPLPQSLQVESNHPSKRQTPEPSNAGTPASSTDSFEMIEHPTADLTERARMRQLELEATLRKRREVELANEQYARSLQQAGSSQVPSSSKPNVQTTLNHKGSFQRPPVAAPQSLPTFGNQIPSWTQVNDRQLQSPPVKVEPHVKVEPGSSSQHRQLPQRPRHFEVIDLTNSDDDDDDERLTKLMPIGSSASKPGQGRPGFPVYVPKDKPTYKPYMYRAPEVPAPQTYTYSQQFQTPHRQLPMPGAFPLTNSNGNGYVYGNAAVQAPQDNSWMQPNGLLANTMNGLHNMAGNLGDAFSELNNLINGSQRSNLYPYGQNEDDDLIFGGSRPLNPGVAAPYAGHDDLYRRRYDDIAHYDPAKTTEEINQLLENIRPDEEMPAHLRVQTPEAMSINLHKYQELGLTWLQNCETGSNQGGILADDMGLGKTIQMLSLIVTHKSEDPRCKSTLIVAPLALMRQWQQEIEQKIKPGRHRLTVFVQHGQSKKKDFRDLQHYDIVLTTYGSLAAELKKLEAFHLRKKMYPETRPNNSEKCALISDEAMWYRVILDEAQCIKNTNTKTAMAACRLSATYRFCMTGTPMMNGVDEFYSLVKFLRIRPYNEWQKFRLDISGPLKSARGEYGKEKAMQMLQALCKAVMLRRTKQSTFEGQPILVLPERTTEVTNPEFSEDELTFYQALENRTQLQFNRYLARGTVGSSYSAILVLLLRLRQACCHPHLIKDFGVAAVAGVTPEALVDLAKELGPGVVARIKETGGNFECPVCYDAVVNPAIFLPCGHHTCRECFAKIADPSNAIRDGNEDGSKAKCPTCRADVDPKRITDFESFKKVHMPELLSAEEKAELEQFKADMEAAEKEDSETESEDSESEDEVDAKGNLANFVVNDNEDIEEGSSERDDEEEGVAGPSEKASKPKEKKSKPAKKGKGKGKKREKKEKTKAGAKAVTLAEMKKLATRSAKAKRAYMRRLRNDWITSAKIEKTMETLREIVNSEEGEKVLIFSQWTSLLDLLEVPIDGEGWGYRRYDGSMNSTMRNDAVDDFRDHRKDVRIMLVSLKAGNAGLNLNMASQVIILDPFWNPYVEEQAIDRAHRLGQTRPVKVHRVLVANTVEDRIIELQEKKRAIISTALDEKAGQNIARLGVQELAYLFGVTRNPGQQVAYVPRDTRR